MRLQSFYISRVGYSAIALTLFATLLLSGCKAEMSDEVKADEETAAIPVEVVAATRRAVAASYMGTAALEPVAESQVVAKTSGVALSVLVREGQLVKAGQTLVRLDPDRPQLAVAQTEAQMRKLENNYRRAQQLVTQQMVSISDVDQLKYDLDNARAQHRLTTLELSYTNVVAPISGVIASSSIKTGNFVQINTPIMRIVDNSQLEATLNVPERELVTLKTGQPVILQVDALPTETFNGTVSRIAPVVDAGSGTFRVVCAFDEAQLLQPGMFGRLRINYDQRNNALVIPRAALLDEGTPAVFVIQDNKATRTTVSLGYAEEGFVEILSGLAEGDEVVTAGKITLRDGSLVQVIGKPVPQIATAAPVDKQ